jgi:choline dehydrogenase
VTMPKGFARVAVDPRLAWSFHTEPQPHRGRAAEVWQRGRMLGGSSAVNGMIYIRGQAEDYDAWAEAAGPAWSWTEMARCFREIEDHSLAGDGIRGAGGPLTVTAGHFRPALCERLIEAGEQAGAPRNDDFNGATQEGIGYYSHTIRRGRRLSAAGAFLDPVRRRPNLRIVTGAQVERVIFEHGRASGVLAHRNGRPQRYAARREVVLCAGALMSPKLLQLSGVGDAARLRQFGVEIHNDLPAVGGGMRDHVGLNLVYRLRGAAGHNRRLRGAGLAASAAQYYLRRTGILSVGPFEVGAFVRTSPDVERPDAQLYMSPFSLRPTAPGEGYLGRPETEPGLTIGAYLLRPSGEGEVTICSADWNAPVRISPRWLADPADVAAGARLMALVRKLVSQPALAPLIDHEIAPGPSLSGEADLGGYFLREARTGNHAVGTCRMGLDADSVLDSQLRVRGVRGLRIVDASAMPGLVSGNTNGPVMALAWRAAELIRAGGQRTF